MDKPLKDYLPKKTEVTLVQARIPKDLADRMKPFLNKNELSWSDFLIASVKKFIDEQKK
jgi:hypothetical protein